MLLRGETEKPHSGIGPTRVVWTDVQDSRDPSCSAARASGLPVFTSDDLVPSTTRSWPSFERPISEERVIYSPDGGEREVLCA